MDNLIIDVALGLILIYLAMAVLLMRLQEGLQGGLRSGRVKNMHKLLREATGHDPKLKRRVLENPLIFSLSEGTRLASKGGLRAANGPAAIPPDLFAKALLMELNPSGQLPSSEALTPLAFMDNLLKNTETHRDKGPGKGEDKDGKKDRGGDAPVSSYDYLRALRALIPSRTTGWPQFETAIATWFSDIGDRSRGWYKRSSSRFGLILAILLCAVMNVDTGNIVNTLGADSELRQGLGDLADRIVQQRLEGSAPAASQPAPAASPVDPATTAIARLVDAIRSVSEAYRKDKAITAFGYYVVKVEDVCPGAEVRPFGGPDKQEEGIYVSNSDTWVGVLVGLKPKLQMAFNRIHENADDKKALADSYQCLAHLSSWVQAATVASTSVDTRRVMLDAAKAIEDVQTAVLAVLRGTESHGGLRRLFLTDPDAFKRCAELPGANESNLPGCVLREQTLLNRFPIAPTPSNLRQQFCQIRELMENGPAAGSSPVVADLGKVTAETVTIQIAGARPLPELTARPDSVTNKNVPESLICGDVVLRPQAQLHLPGMMLVFQPWYVLCWACGVLVSALFISLGAPVLFDTLEKWVHLRNAGDVRDAVKSAERGGGTIALPMLTSTEDQTVQPARLPRSSTLTEVESASPGFEEQLTTREMQAVKQRLGIQPSTGGFDDATRAAIRAFTNGSDQLTLASYASLMGRAPVQAGPSVGALPTDGAQLRQPFAQAPALADHLGVKLGFVGRVEPTETRFSDELRALAVLYRFKTRNPQNQDSPILKIADGDAAAQLDAADAALVNEMLGTGTSSLARFANAPWMDVALGELGQVETNGSSRGTSNPRVCDYLDAASAGLGDKGDTTPWCAAFVTWVLKHRFATQPPSAADVTVDNGAASLAGWVTLVNGFAIPAAVPERAANWKGWPRPGAASIAIAGAGGVPAPQVGDVVVVDNGQISNGQPGSHVGFVFQVDGANQVFWMIAGNQHARSRVCLSRWTFAQIQ